MTLDPGIIVVLLTIISIVLVMFAGALGISTTYKVGTVRLKRRFVIRKNINGCVKWFQICSWEEVYTYEGTGDGFRYVFIPKKFFNDTQWLEERNILCT